MADISIIEGSGKVIALLAATLAVYRALVALLLTKADRLKSDYEFAEKLLGEGRWIAASDYLLERGFIALTGASLRASEIRFFLSQKDPSSKIRNFIRGQGYLTFEKSEDGGKIQLKPPYDKPFLLKLRMLLSQAGYFIFACIAIAPLMLLPGRSSLGANTYVALVVWLLSFSLLAYDCLMNYVSMLSAARSITSRYNEE